ncbi:MAG: hypothetical protein PHF63_00055 [Herbinix sp.]|nr:hypothetical protein [Herbinix sp.]
MTDISKPIYKGILFWKKMIRKTFTIEGEFEDNFDVVQTEMLCYNISLFKNEKGNPEFYIPKEWSVYKISNMVIFYDQDKNQRIVLYYESKGYRVDYINRFNPVVIYNYIDKTFVSMIEDKLEGRTYKMGTGDFTSIMRMLLSEKKHSYSELNRLLSIAMVEFVYDKMDKSIPNHDNPILYWNSNSKIIEL